MQQWNRVSTTAERLSQALTNANMKQADLSRVTGIDKGSIHHYMTGRYEPKSSAINKMAVALNVSETWLWGFDVPMERKTSSTDKQELTDGEKVWLELYRQLSDDTREVLINVANSFDKLPTDTQNFLLGAVRVALNNQK